LLFIHGEAYKNLFLYPSKRCKKKAATETEDVIREAEGGNRYAFGKELLVLGKSRLEGCGSGS
jgi:hypothetical protein